MELRSSGRSSRALQHAFGHRNSKPEALHRSGGRRSLVAGGFDPIAGGVNSHECLASGASPLLN